ncbi:hypothetical protein NXX53_22245 [Bacteroides salyersiae]|nr:hypothetical protein [Bacteroides salyersiae]
MENKKLNEQESLALITQMIQNSKKGLVVGSGNSFLFWGYLTLAVSIAIFLLLYITGNQSLVLVGDCDSGDRMSVYLLGFPAEW